MKIFYIAPHYFDSEFDSKFQSIEKTAEEFGFEISKGIKNSENEFNRSETMKLYDSADYFIADLSFERPSCYYEVGFVQGLQKKVFLIALKNTIIHQVEGEVIFYSNINEYEETINHIFREIGEDSSQQRL